MRIKGGTRWRRRDVSNKRPGVPARQFGRGYVGESGIFKHRTIFVKGIYQNKKRVVYSHTEQYLECKSKSEKFTHRVIFGILGIY